MARTDTFIYALVDPRTDEIRYVGKADSPSRRFHNHCCEDAPTWKCNWIKSLRREGLVPVLRILEEVRVEDWRDAERQWIAALRECGNLTNLAAGGRGGGVPGQKRRQLRPRRKHSPETRAKISAANKGLRAGIPRPEHSARLKGRPLTPEHRQAIAQALIGRDHTWGEKIAEAHRQSPAVKAAQEKAAAARRGAKASPETLEKMRQARLGTKHSEETKAKMREAQRARRQREMEARV